MSLTKLLVAAKGMPALYHRDPEEEYDADRSEVMRWLMGLPEARDFIFREVQARGAIAFDPVSKKWSGVPGYEAKVARGRPPGEKKEKAPAKRKGAPGHDAKAFLEVIRAAAGHGAMGFVRLRSEVVKVRPIGVSALYRVLDALICEGLVIKTKDGKYRAVGESLDTE